MILWGMRILLELDIFTDVSEDLPDEGLIMEVPHSDVTIRAAGKADLCVGADG